MNEPMTNQGLESLKEELNKLTKEQRPKIIESIAAARELGDLKENAEYHTAKDRQGMIEGRILEIENKLRGARVIDITKIPPAGRVLFGCTVSLQNLANNKKVKYQIVGDDEADPAENKISYSSPLAKAMMAKMLKEEIKVVLPDETLKYTIVKIEHI